MKALLLLILFWTCTYSQSQPTITKQQQLWQINDEFEIKRSLDGIENLEGGDSGENVSWNFESLPFDEVTILTVKPPASTKYNYVLHDGFFDIDELYVMQNDSLYLAGFYIEDINDSMLNSPPVLYSWYPMNFGDTAADSTSSPPDSTGTTIIEKVTFHIDAYGTLTTPYDIYEDVLRVKQVKTFTITDSNDVVLVEEKRTFFTWFSNKYRYPLMRLMRSAIGSNPPSTFQIDVLDTRVINSSPEKLINEEFTVYPNPASNEIHVNYSNSVKLQSIEIMNVNGVVVQQHKIRNAENHPIDISQLPAGIYFLKASNNTTYTVKRFVKQ